MRPELGKQVAAGDLGIVERDWLTGVVVRVADTDHSLVAGQLADSIGLVLLHLDTPEWASADILEVSVDYTGRCWAEDTQWQAAVV